MAVDIDFMKSMSAKLNLNPLNSVTVSSFSMEYIPEITETEIELLTDINTLFDYQNSIRRGITRAICHYGEVNNK